MSAQVFSYPLKFSTLKEFCHPQPGHVFERPAILDGEALAGNGYILLRAKRGHWLECDFYSPHSRFISRFVKAPWRDLDNKDDWRPLDAIRPQLFHFGIVPAFIDWKRAPSPVWHVGGVFLARLSHLQLIARLPGCEVLPPKGRALDAEPLHFRFHGGRGMIAHDPLLELSSYRVFAPQYCPLDKQEIRRFKPLNWNFGTPPPPEPPIDNWPPVVED